MPARPVMKSLRIAAPLLAIALVFACVDRQPTLPDIRAAAGGGGGGVTVTATDPDSATQDTTLDVVVSGSGFDQGSQAQWAIAGVPSAKVRTNSTRFVTPKKLIANITIAIDADTGLYDVLVTASTGKKGIGSELFAVTKKGNPNATSPDPVIGFFDGGNLRVMNADGTNATTLRSGVYAGRGPSWAPFGDGTATNPYRLVFEQNGASCPLATIDVDTVGGTVHASNFQQLPTPNYACAPAWSPLGDEISYGGNQEGGFSALFVIPAGGGTPTALYTPPPNQPVFWSAWRSDGTAIAFTEGVAGSSGTHVKVLNRVTGVVTTVVDPSEYTEVRTLSWARTRDVLAIGGARRMNKTFIRFAIDTIPLARDANGNYVRAGLGGRIGDGIGPSWSSDDRKIAYNGVKVITLATGSIQQLAQGGALDWRR